MWKPLAVSLALLALLLPGCDEPASASSRPHPAPAPAPEAEDPTTGEETSGDHGDFRIEPMGPMEPGRNYVSPLEVSVLRVTRLEPREATTIESESPSRSHTQELEPGPRMKLIGLLVRVSNTLPGLRITLGTHRFRMETETGKQFEPVTEHRLTPAISETSLTTGQTSLGWIVFQVPSGERVLILTSDLRRPRVEIKIVDLES